MRSGGKAHHKTNIEESLTDFNNYNSGLKDKYGL